jgi:hypothetical protein
MNGEKAETKKCPLREIANLAYVGCIEGECALYDEEYRKCCFAAISHRLRDLDETLRNKL